MTRSNGIAIVANARATNVQQIVAVYQNYFLTQGLDSVTVIWLTAHVDDDQASIGSVLLCCSEVLVCGGDGTLQRVAQVAVNQGRTLSEMAQLTPIPCGTGNDFARQFGLTHWQWRLQHQVTSQTVSVGRYGTRVFINSLGLGLTAAITQRCSQYKPWLRKRLGRYAYAVALVAWFVWGKREASSLLLHVAVSPYCGGGLCLHPHQQQPVQQLSVLRLPMT